MSRKVDYAELELVVGLILLFASWFAIFLIVLGFISFPSPYTTIAVSILCYIVSIVGLALSSHGLMVIFAVRRTRRERHRQ